MVERRSGTIINIGSALGLITLPFTGERDGGQLSRMLSAAWV